MCVCVDASIIQQYHSPLEFDFVSGDVERHFLNKPLGPNS